MNNSLIAAILTLAITVSHAQKPQSGSPLKQMEWLLGGWARVNNPAGKSGYEYWEVKTNLEWHGRGITLKGTDTTFVETLKIVAERGALYYVADVPGNNKPVYFEITSITENSFVGENPSHDFPKRIEYRFDGTQIHARVSAGSQGIDYVFERRR